MASFVNAVGTAVTTVATPFTPTLPTWAAGDLVLICLYGKYGNPAMNTPSGWTSIRSHTSGTVTTGNDAGDSFVKVYGRVMQTGDTAPAFTFTAASYNSLGAVAVSYRPTSGNTWTDASNLASIPWVATNDTTAATPLGSTGTFSTQPAAASGATIVAFGAIPTDLGTTAGTPTITNSGISGGTASFRNYTESSAGNDSAGMAWDLIGFTGTATGATTVQITPTGATNNYGPTLALWLRETAATPSVQQKTFRGRTASAEAGAGLNGAFV